MTKNDSQSLVVAQDSSGKHLALASTLFDGLDSEHTRRAYTKRLAEFFSYAEANNLKLDKAGLDHYKRRLRDDGLGTAAINIRLSAIRHGLREMADRGMLDSMAVEMACKVKGVAKRGTRAGNWLTLEEAEKLINAPDTSTALGLRDRAILALLVGAGLRRAECASLTVEHIQQREGRWAIIDLVGKRNKVRSVPIADWVKELVDAWTSKAGIRSGHICRQCGWGEKFRVEDAALSDQGVYRVAQRYGWASGKPHIATHDLRRTFAKLARKNGSAIEQIQLSLGHESIGTTQVYLGSETDWKQAPSDAIKLSVTS